MGRGWVWGIGGLTWGIDLLLEFDGLDWIGMDISDYRQAGRRTSFALTCPE
jgi:hypothetical protein